MHFIAKMLIPITIYKLFISLFMILIAFASGFKNVYFFIHIYCIHL